MRECLMAGLSFKMTLIDAGGNELEVAPGKLPPGCIGAVVESATGRFTCHHGLYAVAAGIEPA
jgi:hypothetical protein